MLLYKYNNLKYMKKSKKIITMGLMALYSINALSAHPIDNNSFEDVKAEYTQSIEEDVKNTVENDEQVVFEHLHTGEKFDFLDIYKSQKGGVYKNPFEESEILTISFAGDRDDFNDQEDLVLNDLEELDMLSVHDDEYSEIFGLSNYQDLHYVLFKDLRDSFDNRNQQFFSYHTDFEESFYEHNLNFINISPKQIETVKQKALEKGYSQEVADAIPLIVIYHEIGHSSKNVANQRQDYYNKMRNNEISSKDLEFKRYVLGDESFSDSYGVFGVAKHLKAKGMSKETFQEFMDFYVKEHRDDSKIPEDKMELHFNKTAPLITGKFIEEHWDHLEQFSNEDVVKISASITNLTTQNKLISPHISTHKGQINIARKGGISEEITKQVSDSVLSKINSMVNLTLNDKGEVSMTFDYQPNAYKKQNMRI